MPEVNSAIEFHDGQLLPMDCIAVCPFEESSVADLIRQLPRDMCAEVTRLVALRTAGLDDDL